MSWCLRSIANLFVTGSVYSRGWDCSRFQYLIFSIRVTVTHPVPTIDTVEEDKKLPTWATMRRHHYITSNNYNSRSCWITFDSFSAGALGVKIVWCLIILVNLKFLKCFSEVECRAPSSSRALVSVQDFRMLGRELKSTPHGQLYVSRFLLQGKKMKLVPPPTDACFSGVIGVFFSFDSRGVYVNFKTWHKDQKICMDAGSIPVTLKID